VREGDARVGGDRERGADPGDDLELHPVVLEELRLLAAPGEEERVSPLEADDLLPGLRLPQHQLVELILPLPAF